MARLFSAACERNQRPIFDVLRGVLPPEGLLLEIASGTGMHAAWMAPLLPKIIWQPTDLDRAAIASIEAWREDAECSNLRPALQLDVCADPWPVEHADAVFNSNMIHISPWACTLGLLTGAARVLDEGAPLLTYGPYRRGGEHTAASNARFDANLRARDPSWGVRDLEEVVREAEARGFALERVVEMPANNLMVILRRGPR